MMQNNEVMTTNEAMKFLKTTKLTLLKMVHNGKIRANLIGNGYRFLKSELERYLVNGKPGPAKNKDNELIDMKSAVKVLNCTEGEILSLVITEKLQKHVKNGNWYFARADLENIKNKIQR